MNATLLAEIPVALLRPRDAVERGAARGRDSGADRPNGAARVLTREQIIIELERACRTLRRMKFPRHGAPPKVESALGCHLPEALPDRFTAYGVEPERVTRILPSMADIDHHDRWFPLVYKSGDPALIYVRLALGAEGIGLGWRKVGRLCNCSHEQARRRFEDAIDTVRLYVIRNPGKII